MLDVSVVVTVKNEEGSISQLLHSFEDQSLKPSEVIIVDGGSNDRTAEIVQSFAKNRKSYELIIADGANRGQGRNIGISSAKSEKIAITDAGVVLDRFWLERLIKPIDDEGADFVAGVYVQGGKSLLQKCIGTLQYPNIDRLRADDFLPSCRSVAFTKYVWKTVGCWPEHLDKADDTYFDLLVREKGFKVALAKDAIVSFPARSSFKDLFQQYSSYAEWDVRARLLSRLKIYQFMILAYVLLGVFAYISIAFGLWGFMFSFTVVGSYLVFNGAKAIVATRKLLAFPIACTMKLTIFVAETYGIVKGLIRRISASVQGSES
jgi:glycosyltransferase involved in cell wall biosynthesis